MKALRKLRLLGLNLALTLPYLALAESTLIQSPIKAKTIEELLALLINAAIVILMPVVVLMIVYSGFLFLTARGNKEQLSKAKINFVWVVVGSAVLLGAKVIAEVLKKTAEQITN